jgi:hypothetical protein
MAMSHHPFLLCADIAALIGANNFKNQVQDRVAAGIRDMDSNPAKYEAIWYDLGYDHGRFAQEWQPPQRYSARFKDAYNRGYDAGMKYRREHY